MPFPKRQLIHNCCLSRRCKSHLWSSFKNRESESIVRAWTEINNKFDKAGASPNTYVIDNEASSELKTIMHDKGIKHQLVPPHNHRANLAERAIQTFKNHFIAILSSVDPAFPLSLWDYLLQQTNITLNLLRTARSNPKLSAYAYLFGNFNFQATPLAPALESSPSNNPRYAPPGPHTAKKDGMSDQL